ncbi:hypothetical protein PRECH8_24410 [Insulibacter thermoxylanivorax]|uniref:N-acylneuraminate cytidylyltransferase n=1 Tax=Insulibacter thermoxylanivorax TaxID=2749268 RepID=A0A916QE82_9BACL|nr:acylneuraminate cytidylyltransferase family protein [Insulibacter thermoxylanivorax]GFR39145.1 hypothetical protein PRECH8_24410 [Insulibacter thermoxylanivorax]
MEATLKTVAFIPVRGGSKSIPLKNIKPIAGRPLIWWTLTAAEQCPDIERIFVSTDSEEIRRNVNQMNFSKVTVIDRSVESATDSAASEVSLLEFAEKHEFYSVVFIQATSPLTTSQHLTEALAKYFSSDADSLLSVVRQKRFIWERANGDLVVPINYDPQNRPRRQDFEGYLVENGAFYITSREQLLKSKCRISGKITYYEMPEESYVEIDELEDWVIVEELIKRRKY